MDTPDTPATLSEKVAWTKATIDLVVRTSALPALMCSFGKDSMVLLHLCRAMGLNLPVIFHRDPWFPRKYSFARQVIERWDLTTHDYPPLAVSLWEGKGIMAFNQHYQVGVKQDGAAAELMLPKNIVEPDLNTPGAAFLCGLKDFLGRPVGSFRYPWTCVLIGHKSSDEDQIAGKVPLHADIKLNHGAGPDAVFPLRHWTDADVWEYTDANDVPVQTSRYTKEGGQWHEREDKTANSDYWHACIRCLDRRQPSIVRCPKLDGLEVTNISATVPYVDIKPDYFGERAQP